MSGHVGRVMSHWQIEWQLLSSGVLYIMISELLTAWQTDTHIQDARVVSKMFARNFPIGFSVKLLCKRTSVYQVPRAEEITSARTCFRMMFSSSQDVTIAFWYPLSRHIVRRRLVPLRPCPSFVHSMWALSLVFYGGCRLGDWSPCVCVRRIWTTWCSVAFRIVSWHKSWPDILDWWYSAIDQIWPTDALQVNRSTQHDLKKS